MEVLIVTGPPYSGKGTQCDILKATLGFAHISTGDRLRKEKEAQTPIGKIMTTYEQSGSLVPDEIMQELISIILDENLGEKGIILDGYPRTKAQVDTILILLAEKNLEVNTVININVPKEELLIRAKKRAANSSRTDDQDTHIHLKRIEIFEEETRPAIEYMKTKFRVENIDGLGSIENITKAIKEKVIAGSTQPNNR